MPADRCAGDSKSAQAAVAVFQCCDYQGEGKRRPDVRFVVGQLHGSVQSQGGGGGGCGGEGGGVYVPSTRRERRSSSSPVHRCALLVTPMSSPLFSFVPFFLRKQSNHSIYVVAFRGTVCQWYAEPEYPVEMRIRPHSALGQCRVLRSRFHPATFCVGTVDTCVVDPALTADGV